LRDVATVLGELHVIITSGKTKLSNGIAFTPKWVARIQEITLNVKNPERNGNTTIYFKV